MREHNLREGSGKHVSTRGNKDLNRKPWKLLLWTVVAGLIFGMIGAGEAFEDQLRVTRNNLHLHNASGQIVVIRIDDQALRAYGNWPWPRRNQAQLVDRLTAAGAKRIFYDINFSYASDHADDAAFAAALARSGRVSMLARSMSGPNGTNTRIDSMPLPAFTAHAQLSMGSVWYNWQNAVWHLSYAQKLGGQTVPSFASAMANVPGETGKSFPLDYSIRVASIPSYSAADVLSGKVNAAQLKGRDIIIGITSDVLGDRFFIPSFGRGYGVYVHAIGAETLKNGRPVEIGWVPGFLFALAGAAISACFRPSPFERSALRLGRLETALISPRVR